MKLEDIVWKIMVGIATQHTSPSDKDKFVKEIKDWAKGCVSEKLKPSSLAWDFHDCRIWNNCRKGMLENIKEG